MLSLEPELQSIRAQLGEHHADALIARERRDVFSIYPELRILGWLGATLIATAAGIVLKNNLERLGPITLALMMAVAAIACYAWTWLRRARASVVDDYVLLLGALLVSADVAFIESQFRLFGDAWKHHLLILAVVHAIGAYVYGSRMLLSLSIVAFASWMGFDKDRSFEDLFIPAFETAALLIAWRAIHRKVLPPTANRQPPTNLDFSRTFEHFAAHIALTGALTLMVRNQILGGFVTLAIAAIVIAWGFRTRSEPFVLYGFVYAVIAVDAILLELIGNETAWFLVLLVSMIAAIAGLIALHARFKEVRA
jgi:Predicted membrane protein (DUF2157)